MSGNSYDSRASQTTATSKTMKITKGDNVNDHSTPMEHLRVVDKQSLDYVLRSGIAGGIAGSAAKTLIAPLDRIKILFQTSNPDFLQYRGKFVGLFKAGRRIWSSDGLYGLFQGHSVTLIRIFPYALIKFVAYEQIRAILIPNDSYETAVRRFMSGSLSGLASVFFTYPLDLIRVRMAFETRNLQHQQANPKHDHKRYMLHRRGRLWNTVNVVYLENSLARSNDPGWLKYLRETLPKPVVAISNFYRGFAPTILGMIPYAGVSFYVHDLIHDIFRIKLLAPYTVAETKDDNNKHIGVDSGKVESGATNSISKLASQANATTTSRDVRAPLKAYAQLIAGGLAGLCSQTAAYPFEVIRRRMQVGGAINNGQFMLFKSTAKLIFQESGFKGFFVGLSVGYIKVVPMAATSLYVYDRCKHLLSI